MSDLGPTATSVPTAPRRSARGAVVVGDYLGEPAAEAARAVRRLGLRPGLDRQFGGEPHTIGLVLAQEPQPGGEAPRGAMVTLYVSAPAAGGQEPPPKQEEEGRDDPEPGDDPPAPPSPSAGGAPSTERARRKRRPGARAPAIRDQPPPPVVLEEPPAPRSDMQEGSQWRDGDQGEQGTEASDPAWDQLTLAMRDVFHPEAFGVGHRGIYPRKPVSLRVRGGWTWLKAHRSLATLACALLAVSMSAAVTGEQKANRQRADWLGTSPPPAHRTRANSTSRASGARRSLLQERASRRPAQAAHVTAASTGHRRAAAGARHTGQPTAPTSSTSVRGESPPMAGSAAPAPTTTQSGGGPFSP
jgi:hypothetical protein